MERSPYSNDQYTIGWISALGEELSVAMAMLDEEHGRPQAIPRDDTNTYHLGRIGEHNIVMACLSGGQMGTGPAAIVAENMRRTFKNIRFALLVGIGGGVPDKKKDVRLGDVVVSHPYKTYTGVVQYDYGKLKGHGHIERKDWFCAPPPKLLSAVNLLKALHDRPKNPKNNMLSIIDELGDEYMYPDEKEAPDHLFKADYDHIPEAETCSSSSGNMVIKNGIERDEIDKRYNNAILCLEMEAAGLMNNFPCLVIRGISDYADSHKNDYWRNRAIASASAYAKELVLLLEAYEVESLSPIAAQIVDTVSRIDENTKEIRIKQQEDLRLRCESWLKPPNSRATQQRQFQKKLPQTCDWIWTNSDTVFFKWFHQPALKAADQIICIHGSHGCGKSVLASSMADHMWNQNIRVLFFAFSAMDSSLHYLDKMIRSLIWQLLGSISNAAAINIIHKLMPNGQPVRSDLWAAFDEMAVLVKELVHCIIDGIDESMDEEKDEDSKAATTLLSEISNFLRAHSNFRFILLGRSHAFEAVDIIHHKFRLTPDLTGKDIDRIIDTKIASSNILSLPEIQDTVRESLRRQSDGSFLWVHLMLGSLRRSLTKNNARKQLRDMPNGLQEAYKALLLRLVRKVNKAELEFAKKVLQVAIVSRHPLGLGELQHLLAADAMVNSKNKKGSFDDHLILSLGHRILEICGDFITIADDHVRLVHFSLEEFLVRPKDQWSKCGKASMFRVVTQDAHQWVGAACIEYNSIREYGSPLHDWKSLTEPATSHPFLSYSSTSMIFHIYHSSLSCAPLTEKIDKFLDSNRLLPWVESLLMYMVEDESLHSHLEELEKFWSWLDKNPHSRNFSLLTILAHLVDCLEERRLEYGQDDFLTEQLQCYLEILKDIDSPINVQVEKFRVSQSINEPVPDFLTMAEMLQKEASLPLRLQVDLLLKLVFYLNKAERLTDPLKLLFRIIAQRAAIIPIYVLLVIDNFYENLGKHDQALAIYLAALQKTKKKEGRNRFLILHLIGISYSRLHQYELALKSFRDALSGRERLLGPDHEDTLLSFHWTSCTFYNLEQYDKALEYHTKALTGQEKVLGLDHKDTLRSYYRMGRTFYSLELYGKALEYHTKALIGEERVLGIDHKDTLLSYYWMGHTFYRLKQYDEALEYSQKDLSRQEKLLGLNHEDTLVSLYDMGCNFKQLGQYDKALECHMKALTGREKLLGSIHRQTLSSMYWVGIVFRQLRQYNNALEWTTKALAGQEEFLGLEHEATLWTREALCYIKDEFLDLGVRESI
ncbi:hypothetical protein F5884DRAFT_856993 [Xylogone sp. PMI_703]|nr:hypothetical protein F5884DRAFT_856993 [Xylogone sp. PMI_703]